MSPLDEDAQPPKGYREEPSFEIDVPDYEGTRVVCTSAQWHIKIELGHPELSGEQDAVAEAITEPEMVLQDRDYPDRRHFIRRTAESLYLVAVVEYQYMEETLTGRLVTAFLRRRLRRDDHVLFLIRR